MTVCVRIRDTRKSPYKIQIHPTKVDLSNFPSILSPDEIFYPLPLQVSMSVIAFVTVSSVNEKKKKMRQCIEVFCSKRCFNF